MTEPTLSLITSLADLDRTVSAPLYHQLYVSVRKAITRGKLPPGTRLPSARRLANALDVSRTTIENALNELRTEGYLHRRVGSGTYVSEELPDRYTQVRQASSPRNIPSQPLSPPEDPSLSDRVDRVAEEPLSMFENTDPRTAFSPGAPAVDAFPIDVWSTLAARRWRSVPASRLTCGDPAGYPPLRRAVAKYLRSARGVQCEPAQVLIVSGIQQACTLSARVLLNPGDDVYIQDPSFPRLRAAFKSVGAHLHSVAEDPVRGGRSEKEADASPRMMSVLPSHQYPFERSSGELQRGKLLEWAATNDVWIFESDYDSEFRFSGQPNVALQGLDKTDRVLYAGTFSKVMFPALRLGYLVVPPNLVDPFVKMRTLSDRCPPRVDQMILTDFITEGYFEQHIRRVRTLYAARRDTFLKAVNDFFKGFIEVGSPNAGLHLIGWLPERLDEWEVSRRLKQHGIVAPPLSLYSERTLDRGALVFGFAGISEEKITDRVRRMARVFDAFPSEGE